MLIVFAGLPGAGKSTIAKLLATRMKAVYLRIDTIEQALRACASLPAGVVTEGYAVGYHLAEDNLRLGHTVIADSVNPLAVTRDAWVAVADRAKVPVIEVEVICSDAAEHQRRVATRATDVPGLVLPTWDAVQQRDYDAWTRPRIVVDTASQAPPEAVEVILNALPPDA